MLVRLPMFLPSPALYFFVSNWPVSKIHINTVASIFYQLHFLTLKMTSEDPVKKNKSSLRVSWLHKANSEKL